MPKRILIFYITNLSGHHKAAKALERTLTVLDRECEVYSYDILKFLHPVFSKVINFLYGVIIKKCSWIWGNVYDKKKVFESLVPFRRFTHFCDFFKMRKVITRINPHVVICTQAYPCGVVSDFKRKSGYKFSLVGVVTDFWAHRFWFHNNVDYYIIPSAWCKEGFYNARIPESKLKPLGIPIDPEFTGRYPGSQTARRFGLREGVTSVLIMGGGSGIGPLCEVADILDKSGLDLQVVVVCGKNRKLYNRLSTRKFKRHFRIFPYIEDIYKLMEFVDIIITKPGGITTSEALSKNVAMIILKPIPGQEENNAKFLLDNGLAVKADTVEQVGQLVRGLLTDAGLLERLKSKGKYFSKPDASLNISKLILESLEK